MNETTNKEKCKRMSEKSIQMNSLRSMYRVCSLHIKTYRKKVKSGPNNKLNISTLKIFCAMLHKRIHTIIFTIPETLRAHSIHCDSTLYYILHTQYAIPLHTTI